MIDIPTGTYLIERSSSSGIWDTDGKYQPSAKENINILASIQPITGSMIKLLPENRRNSESIVVYSSDRLFGSDEKNQRAADILTYDNKKFEIHSCKNWADLTDIPHYESIGILIDGQGANHV